MKEKVLQRQQGSYILTVEAGRQLLLSADGRAETSLQAELTDIQDRWKRASMSLDEQKKVLATLLKVNKAAPSTLYYIQIVLILWQTCLGHVVYISLCTGLGEV